MPISRTDLTSDMDMLYLDHSRVEGKSDRFIKVLTFVMGTVSSMASIRIPLGEDSSMTLFTSLFILLVFYCMVTSKGKLHIPHNKDNHISLLNFYFFLVIVSSLVGVVLMPGNWAHASLSGLISDLFGIIGIYYFTSAKQKQMILKPYFKGLLCCAVIQLIWSFFQVLYFELRYSSLNKDLGLYHASATARDLGDVVAGIGWERAQLCTALLVGFCLCKNRFLKIAFAVMTIATGSRTCFVMLLCILLFSVDYGEWLKKLHKISIGGILFFLGCILLLGIWGSNLADGVMHILERFADAPTEGSGMAHIWYYAIVPSIIERTDLIHLFLGFGNGCSGYPYSAFFLRNTKLDTWSVESGTLSLLWDFGVIAWIIFWGWFLSLIHSAFHYKTKLRGFLLAVPICSLGYTLLLNWVILAFILEEYAINHDQNEI